MPSVELDVAVDGLVRWLQEAAWPIWLERGVDRARGGFFEALDLRTHACTAPFRRLRVVARQITVFSEGYRAGLPDAAEAVALGVGFLDRQAASGEDGFAWRYDLDHRPIDPTRDLYDHAFILLALSSAAAVMGADALRPRANYLIDWLRGAFAHSAGGYLESLPPSLPRRQNPHMHLLEALLAAYEAFGDTAFRQFADELLDLFATRLFDNKTGALPEYFDDRLRPDRNDGVFLVEPGHHCEWVWLLHRAAALGCLLPDQTIAPRLMAFVDRHGLDPVHGGVIDLVGSNGAALQRSARLWPQAERLKAEFLRADPSLPKQLQAVRSLTAYLRPDGLWHERRDAAGVLVDEPAPASSLYHLTGAIMTVARLAGR